MLEFKKIDINDKELYSGFFKKTKELSCENTFVNMLVWQCAYNNMLAFSNGQLFIKSGSGKRESFRLPVGGNLKEGIRRIEEYSTKGSPVFWVQEGPGFEEFKALFGSEYSFFEQRDAFDYIYLQSDLAELSGKKYHSKRNHISAFSKKYDWRYESLSRDNIDSIRLCAEEWYIQNADRLTPSMQCERNGVETILNNIERLDVKGGAIYVGEKAVAFTLGSALSDEVFDIHIEKALGDYAGAYTVINREFAANALKDYKYINREDDMGLEGLRKAKLSYKPAILLKKYRCEKIG